MDKDSQKTLRNKEGRKLDPGGYLILREKNCKLEPPEY